MTISEASNTRENNFNLLRIIAALMVLASHCYPLTDSPGEIFFRYFGYESGGGWGVAIFFVISGFLVTKSCLAHDALPYLFSRGLRILPLLFVVSILEFLILGPLFTTEKLDAYFVHAKRHLLNGFIFWMDPSLPGVFSSNPNTAVNGSLWTLPIETSFYILLPVMRTLGLLRKNVLLFGTVLVVSVYFTGITFYEWRWEHQGGFLFAGVPLYSSVKNAIFFLCGALLFTYREALPLSGGLAACCLLLLLISKNTLAGQLVFFLTLPYLTIYLALRRQIQLRFLKVVGDLSYGTYMFAFPVQQSIVALLGPGLSPAILGVMATPPVLCLAAISWHFIEQPALQLRKKIFVKQTS